MGAPDRGVFSSELEMTRNPNLREKTAQWAVWGAVAVLCTALFFQADNASSSRNSEPSVPTHSAQDDVRAGAGTSAADTLLW
jgi:hypothetical protein